MNMITKRKSYGDSLYRDISLSKVRKPIIGKIIVVLALCIALAVIL